MLRNSESNTFLQFALYMVLVSCFYLAVVEVRYEPFTYLYYDPGWSAEAVKSLVSDGDFDLKNQLNGDPVAANDQTARGVRGEWYPLHELLLPIVAVPLFCLSGLNGLLVTNVILALLFAAGSYKVACLYCEGRAAFFAALASAIAPVTLEYVYSFSADLLGASLLVWAFYFAGRRDWAVSGFVFGASVWGRMINGFAMPAFLIYLAANYYATKSRGEQRERSNRRVELFRFPLVRFALGGAPFAAAFFISNQVMFGGPIELAYRHWVFPEAGPIPVDQVGLLAWDWGEFWKMALDKRSGLIVGAPLYCIGLVFGLRPLRRRDRPLWLFYISMTICILAGVATYRRPFPGTVGNRYLLGLVACSSLPLAAAISRFTEKKIR